ncbi:MAG: hypothetical protein ABEI99_09475 [Halobaculum sp.]
MEELPLPTQPFRVAVKRSALDRNDEVCAEFGSDETVVEYESRAAAEDAAESFAAVGASPVRLQQVAPQDDTDADAYLVAAARYTPLPDRDPDPSGGTYAVDGSTYGALGVTLLTSGDGLARPVEEFVYGDLGVSTDTPLDVRIDTDPEPITVAGETGSWCPDLRIAVSYRDLSLLAYDCEVKTGDGALERNQESIMRAVSDERHVVFARVRIDGLPQTFSVSFQTYGETPTLAADSADEIDADSAENLVSEGAGVGHLPVESSPQQTIDDW